MEGEDHDSAKGKKRKRTKARAKAGGKRPKAAAKKAKAASDEDFDVEFDFMDPCEEDFHPVKQWIHDGRWGFAKLDSSEVADCIVNQGNIGTLIKSEADNDTTLCGFLTVLNPRQFADKRWPQTALKLLRSKSKARATPKDHAAFEALLAKSGKGAEIGIMFAERFQNIPPQLVPAIHKALREDIEWSCSTPECPADERPFYGFTHFVGLAKGRVEKDTEGGASSSSAAMPEAPALREGLPPGLSFSYFEDEECIRHASFAFAFSVSGSGESGEEEEQQRVVFGLTRKAFDDVLVALEARAPR